MKKSTKNTAFTMSEIVIVMVILAIMLLLTILGIKLFDPNRLELRVMGKKMDGYVQQAMLLFMHNNVLYDDMFSIRIDGDIVSILDKDKQDRIIKIYSNYLTDITYKLDTSKKYFNETIKDYDWTDTGIKINEAYSNFFVADDGMIMGFRFYDDCEATEENTHTYNDKGKYPIHKVCGSIFYDVNAEKWPNKLGSDQYIIPFNERGIKIDD